MHDLKDKTSPSASATMSLLAVNTTWQATQHYNVTSSGKKNSREINVPLFKVSPIILLSPSSSTGPIFGQSVDDRCGQCLCMHLTPNISPIHRPPTAVSSTISLNVNVLRKLIMGCAVAKAWSKIFISAKCKVNSHRTSLACERYSNMHNSPIDKCLTY